MIHAEGWTNSSGHTLGPLLTANDTTIYTQSWTKNLPGYYLLRVSAGIRRIAWDIIQENSIWVQARFVWTAADLARPLPSAIFHAMNHVEHVWYVFIWRSPDPPKLIREKPS